MKYMGYLPRFYLAYRTQNKASGLANVLSHQNEDLPTILRAEALEKGGAGYPGGSTQQHHRNYTINLLAFPKGISSHLTTYVCLGKWKYPGLQGLLGDWP